VDPVNIDANGCSDDDGTLMNGCSDDDGTLMVHSGDSRKPALKLTMDCMENKVLWRCT
jgi:hypothetical protein